MHIQGALCVILGKAEKYLLVYVPLVIMGEDTARYERMRAAYIPLFSSMPLPSCDKYFPRRMRELLLYFFPKMECNTYEFS